MFFLPPKNSFEIHNYFIITCDQNTVLTTSFQLLAACFKMWRNTLPCITTYDLELFLFLLLFFTLNLFVFIFPLRSMMNCRTSASSHKSMESRLQIRPWTQIKNEKKQNYNQYVANLTELHHKVFCFQDQIHALQVVQLLFPVEVI